MRNIDRLPQETVAEESFVNRFGKLNVEEPEDVEDDASPSNDDPAQPSVSTPKATVEVDESELEWQFPLAIYVMFQEIGNIREDLRELWKRYRGGHEELMTVAIAANTAIQ